MAYPRHMSLIERTIVDRLVKAALAMTWVISIKDEEEWPVKRSSDYELITSNIAQTDITNLIFRDGDRKYLGMILLIHGNDEDVISDCSDTAEINALCRLAGPE